jgi:hypothetical protein
MSPTTVVFQQWCQLIAVARARHFPLKDTVDQSICSAGRMALAVLLTIGTAAAPWQLGQSSWAAGAEASLLDWCCCCCCRCLHCCCHLLLGALLLCLLPLRTPEANRGKAGPPHVACVGCMHVLTASKQKASTSLCQWAHGMQICCLPVLYAFNFNSRVVTGQLRSIVHC